LPGTYSRLIGEIRGPVPNDKGVLSILAPTTLATRHDLVSSIERQLTRPLGPQINLANAYLNVAQTRDQEARRRGSTVYAEGRILKKDMEVIFNCEPSGLRKNLPPHLKAPLPIASERSSGLLTDLQGRGAIVFCDRFFDANGNQVQDMQLAPDPYPATVLMANAMNTSATLTDLLRQGDIPRLLNQGLKNHQPAQKVDKGKSSADSTRKAADSSSSVKAEPRRQPDPLTPAYDPNAYVPSSGTSRGEKRKEEMDESPSPLLVLAKGLSPMPEGDVLQPFSPQDYRWDDLWLEQDQCWVLRELTRNLLSAEFSDVDKTAVKEVCTFFMNLKKNTRLFQQRVDWKSPNSRIRSVMDRFANSSAAVVSSFQMRKGAKQQRRSSAGMGRDNPDTLSGLTVEWNLDAPSCWVWNDNQRGAAIDDPKLLARLLQKNNVLPGEDDFLAEGKKVLPVEALSAAYKKYLNVDNSFVVQTISYKGGKGKGKGGKFRAQDGKSKARWLPSEPTSFDLLMLPPPDHVNREDGTYLLEGPGNGGIKVLVTSENWATLRFNTKSMNPEYFPSSYLEPVPTDPISKELSKRGYAADAKTFPKSTITGTLKDFSELLRCSPLSKKNKVSAEAYRALSLDIATEASDAADKATAPKRISTFMKLCAKLIPCEHIQYDDTVRELEDEVGDDVEDAKFTLKSVEEKVLPALFKLECESPSVLLQVLYSLQRGHVQFLAADYKSRIIEAYPHAFAKIRPPKLGKGGQPLKITNVGITDGSSGDLVDMTADELDEGETSDIDYNDGEGSGTNTLASSTSQKELRPLKKASTAPSTNIEAASFSSDTSPRTDTGDNDELGQAEGN